RADVRGSPRPFEAEHRADSESTGVDQVEAEAVIRRFEAEYLVAACPLELDKRANVVGIGAGVARVDVGPEPDPRAYGAFVLRGGRQREGHGEDAGDKRATESV